VLGLRLAAGLTQGQLAARAKLGTSTIEKIEQAREPAPLPLTVHKVAAALSVPVEMLTGKGHIIHVPAEDYDAIMRMIRESHRPARRFEEWLEDVAKPHRQAGHRHSPEPEPNSPEKPQPQGPSRVSSKR
jgi:transcriptional regulator with XRE-family HTH domain